MQILQGREKFLTHLVTEHLRQKHISDKDTLILKVSQLLKLITSLELDGELYT